ncbi:MAG: hypothetical protein LBK96_04695 [Prevotellaceae bacterium]|jgi:hypothetical protein|nr:hypothetical protein [Prevotellaceae bacterium]
METDVQKYSGMGIASFVLGTVSITGFFNLSMTLGVIINSGVDKGSILPIVTGLLGIFYILCAAVGIGLGIAECCAKNRRNVFAILGVIFSAIPILLFAIVIGMNFHKL